MIRSLPDTGATVKSRPDFFSTHHHVFDIPRHPRKNNFSSLMLKQWHQYGILAFMDNQRQYAFFNRTEF